MDCAAEAPHSARWVQFLRLPAPFGCGSESTVRMLGYLPLVLEATMQIFTQFVDERHCNGMIHFGLCGFPVWPTS